MKPEKAFWKSPFRSSFIRKSLLMGHSFAADRNILPSSGFLFIARSVRRVFGGLGCLFLIYVFFSSHLFAESLASGPVQTKLVEAGSELVQAGSDFNMNVKDVMLNSSSICSCNPLYSEDGSHYVSITNSPSSLGSVWIYSIHFKPAYYRIWFYDPYSELSDHLLEPGEGGSFLRWYSPGYGNYYLPFFIPTVQATGGSATLEFVIKTKYHDSNGEEKWDEFNFSLSLADGEVFGNYHCYTDNYVFYADGCGSNTYDYDCDGWSPCEGDCNDYNSSAHPGAAEQCDGIDNNCDGIIDLVNCYDGPSGTENTGICHGGTKNVCREYDPCEGEQTPLPELCNNVDDNCNGIVDDINITEACNGVDDNCNNFIDEGCNDTDDQQDQNIKDCGIGQGEDPVNIVTGNYYTHPLQDFFIKSDLMDINFSRFYNSQKIYDGPIGFGWTYSYNIFLINLPDESIKVLLGGGKGLYFTPDGQGGYFPPRGLNYKLNRIQTEWSLINPDGQIYFFNDLGKLNKITNPAGGILEFDYNSESQISKIRSGNIAVQLSYLNGKISEIVGPDDEVLVTYQYDEANNLIHVAYPDNSFINYFYDDYYGDIHNLTGISEEDSSGSILSYQSIGYDSLDRVESLRRGWEILRFNYYPESQYTQIQAYVQDVGGKEPYKVHYNEYGVSTWIEGDCGCGGSSASEWDSSENNLNRTKFTDKNGNETHYQDYDDRGNPGKIIDALGHETFSAYHPVLNTPLYIIKDSVLGLSGTKKITIYDYDDPSSAVDPYPTDNPTDFNQTPTNYLHKMIEKGFTYNSSGQIDHYTYVTRYFYESSETNLQSNNIVLSDLNGDIWLIPYLLDGNFGSKLWVANLGIPIPYPMVADYNQDGNFDIALTGTSEVYLLQNDGNLNFTTKIIASGFSMSNDYYWGATGAAGDFGDFINDPNHLPDIAIKTSAFGPQIVILENLGVINGEIQFLEKGFFSPPNPSYVPTQLKSGYFNNDEYLDLVLGYYGGFFCVMFGDGAGNFPTYSCAGIPGCPAFGGYHEIVAVIAGDFNGDGNTDVLAGQTHDNDAGQSYLFLGDGNGNFNLIGLSCADPWSYEYGYDTNPYSEGSSGDYGIGYGATMDFNGDGALDIVASASYYGIEYFPGVGDGKFGPLTYVDPAEGRVDVASNASMGTGVKRLVSIDGPRTDVADVTSFAYYSDSPDQGYNRGRLKTVADPTGGITRYDDYKLFGNPTKITDPNGRVTLNGYDFRGRLISSTQKEAGPSGEDDLVTQYALDGLGSIKRVTQPNGETIDYQYEDDTHHLLGIAHGTQWVEYDYDWFGNQILDGINDRDFDENNRLFRIYNNDWGTYTQFAYDPNGNRTSVTDDNGNANTYEYDALNRLVQVSGVPASQPSSVLAFYQYDSHDNLISVTSYRAPDSSLLTNYSYDDMGRLVQINSPDSGLARFQYDEAGNLIAKFDANSQETTYSYDVLNRLVELSSLPASQPSSVDVTYAYDQGVNGLGRLSTVTDESGSSSYAYDQRGNLAHENKTLGSLPFALSYSYDANGNVSSITYPSGRVVNYQYDSGLVSGVNATLNGSSTTLASNFTYDGNLLSGKATHFVYGNGLEYVMWFNARYNPWFFVVGAFAGEELAQVTAARFYSYDPVDNIIGFDQYDSFEDLNQGNTAQTDQFGYDPLNRLISADGTYLGDLDFGYDLAGNRISEVDDGKNYDYSYYDGTNRLREVLDPPANSGGSPGSSGSSGLHKNVGQGFSPAFSPSFPSFKNTPSPHPGRHSRGSGNPGVYPSPLRGEGRGEGERVPTDWQRIVGVVPSVPDNFEDLDENGWTDIHDRVDGFCHKWHHKIPEDILIQLKYLKMLIEIKLYALKLSSPSFKSGSSNVGEPLCRLPSGRFYKPEHGKPCPPPPPPPQVTAGEFVGKVREIMYESGLNVPLMFRTWLKNVDLAGLVQGLLTLSGDNPASLVTKDELGQVKQFVKLAMKIKIAEAMREGTTYAYDGNGNITSADNISYEYDSQNRMTKALVNGQPVGEYTYDASGRRVKKTAYGVTTYSIYDQFSNLIAEADASGNITREYIYLNGKPLAFISLPLPSTAPPQTISQQVSGSCGTIFAWNPQEGIIGYAFILSPFLFAIFFRVTRSTKKSFLILLGCLGVFIVFSFLASQPPSVRAQTTGEEIYYYHVDHLGTPIKLTDQNQNVVWSWQYGPFGEEPLTMEPNAISQNLRFPGQYYDAETGLHYNMNRYYSTKLGRYLTPDPIKRYSRYPQPFNTYSYAVNNPVKSKDPLGLASVTNNMPYPVQGSGNPGPGRGSGNQQITFWIQPGQTVNWENPVYVDGQEITDVDFVNPKGGSIDDFDYNSSPYRIRGNDVLPQYDINPNANAKTCSEGQTTRNPGQTMLNTIQAYGPVFMYFF